MAAVTMVIGGITVTAEVNGNDLVLAIDIPSLLTAITNALIWINANRTAMTPSDNAPGGLP